MMVAALMMMFVAQRSALRAKLGTEPASCLVRPGDSNEIRLVARAPTSTNWRRIAFAPDASQPGGSARNLGGSGPEIERNVDERDNMVLFIAMRRSVNNLFRSNSLLELELGPLGQHLSLLGQGVAPDPEPNVASLSNSLLKMSDN